MTNNLTYIYNSTANPELQGKESSLNPLEDGLNTLPLAKWMSKASIAVSVFGSVLGLIGNGFVARFFFMKRKKLASNTFIFALSLVDLSVCMFLIPFLPFIINLTQEKSFTFVSLILQRAWGYLLVFAAVLSLFLFGAIAFDRHRAICTPLKPRISHFEAILTIVLLFIGSFLLTLLAVYSRDVRRAQHPFIWNVGLFQFAGSSFALVLYLRMFWTLHERQKTIGPSAVATQSTSPSTSRPEPTAANSLFTHKVPSVKIIKMLFLMTSIFLASYAPVLIITFLFKVPVYVCFTYAFNHTSNPVVLYLMNSEFRNDLKDFLRNQTRAFRARIVPVADSN